MFTNLDSEPGKITAFVGPMYSGKTSDLVEYLIRSTKIVGLRGQAFKPEIDNRGEGIKVIKTRGGSEFPATPIPIHRPGDIFKLLSNNIKVVGIDEAQFFDPEIANMVIKLSNRGINVAVAGLPADFRGEPFGAMPHLISIAHKIEQRFAVCTYEYKNGIRCGDEATQTQRLINGKPANYHDPIILVGGEESYQARCRRHHIVPGRNL